MSRIHMTKRLLKWGVGGAAVGLLIGPTVAYGKHHNWEMGSTGIVRFGRAAVTAGQIIVDYKISLLNMEHDSEAYRETKSKVHYRCAERLRELCCKNRGAFIKVGQHLAALEYLLPLEYTETLKVLHSSAPRSTIEEVHQVLKEDFKINEIGEVFSYLDEDTCGTASLAQVHKAILNDGRHVAVKVQHPNVQAHSIVDMATMEFLVKLAAKLFPEFKLLWLAEETKKNLPKELDFANEAQNCERMSKMFKHLSFLKVPDIHWDLTTSRVLTMEFCEGGQVNDKEYMKANNINVNEVCRKLGTLYSEMIFEQGYIHCDPHPGNVLVNQTNGRIQIVLLDHGLYQSLTDEFRLNYCRLWMALIKSDMNGIKEMAERLGCGHLYGLFACIVSARSWESVQSGIASTRFTKQEDDVIKTTAAAYLPQVSEILNNIPRQMLLILKTNDLLRGIESTLGVRANVSHFIPMAYCCITALSHHQKHLCNSTWSWIRISLYEQYELIKLKFYTIALWLGLMGL